MSIATPAWGGPRIAVSPGGTVNDCPETDRPIPAKADPGVARPAAKPFAYDMNRKARPLPPVDRFAMNLPRIKRKMLQPTCRSLAPGHGPGRQGAGNPSGTGRTGPVSEPHDPIGPCAFLPTAPREKPKHQTGHHPPHRNNPRQQAGQTNPINTRASAEARLRDKADPPEQGSKAARNGPEERINRENAQKITYQLG